MNFLDLVKKRTSVRTYAEKPIEREKLERCLEAARLAPSACNSQPWTFVLVDEPELTKKLATTTFSTIAPFNKFVLQSKAILAIVMEKPNALSQIGGRIKDRDFYLIDIGIAAEHFCLQATEEGLGTCMLGWFNEREAQKILNIPRNKRIGLLISIGYPKDIEPKQRPRKTLQDVVKINSYK
jgi:nitroreductase